MPSPDTIPVDGKSPASAAVSGNVARVPGSGADARGPRRALDAIASGSRPYRRFVLLSGLAWLASLAVLWLGVNVLQWPAWSANAAGDVLAVSLVFGLYPATVFGSRHRRWLAAFAPWAIWQALHIALISWAVDALSAALSPLASAATSQWVEVAVKVAITPVTLTLNFVVARWLLHRQWRGRS